MADRQRLRQILWWDMTSEYDARFLTAYLAASSLPLSAEFVAAMARWAEDECRHHAGCRAAHEEIFGTGEEFLVDRRPDFKPLRHLLTDEFSICCLLAYDELATVRGYRVNLPLYDSLGPRYGAFIRDVIRDEGRHYGTFLKLLRDHHGHRLHGAPEVIARVRATEGTPYRATFLLDHDEDIYTPELLDQTVRQLLRHLAQRAGVGAA